MKEVNYRRHTCIICGRKRYEHYMKQILISSWVCTDQYYFSFCCDNEEIRKAEEIRSTILSFKHIKASHIFGK